MGNSITLPLHLRVLKAEDLPDAIWVYDTLARRQGRLTRGGIRSHLGGAFSGDKPLDETLSKLVRQGILGCEGDTYYIINGRVPTSRPAEPRHLQPAA